MHYNTIDNEKVYKDGTFKCIHWKDLLEGYIQVPHTAAPRDREQESAVINNKIIRHKKHIITKCNLKCLNNEAISYHLKYILWHAEEDRSIFCGSLDYGSACQWSKESNSHNITCISRRTPECEPALTKLWCGLHVTVWEIVTLFRDLH